MWYLTTLVTPWQANNVLIFPGVGFGAVMSKAKYVEDSMFLAAAEALADHVDADRIANGTVYPELEKLREISAVVSHSSVPLGRTKAVAFDLLVYSSEAEQLLGVAWHAIHKHAALQPQACR